MITQVSRLLARALLAPVLALALTLPQTSAATNAPASIGTGLAQSAGAQIGVTTLYDPAYVRLDFPGGDIAPDRGVCTDVLVRALRASHQLDLQKIVNTDMRAHFSRYPALWGLKSTDRNIDHRRVPNLRRLFEHMGAEVALNSDPAAFEVGDIVTSVLPGNLPHLMIVSDKTARDGTPLVIHNIGRGTREENALFSYPLTGHYRLTPETLTRLRALQ